MACWLLAHELDGFTKDRRLSLVNALHVHRSSEGSGNVRIKPQGWLPQCISPLLASSNRERAREEVEEGIAGGGSGPYLGGGGGGEEVWASSSDGGSEE